MLNEGEADIGIATETLAGAPELVTFPFYTWQHAAIVPAGHPLEAVAADARGDRRISGGHLSRRLHRPLAHRCDFRTRGAAARHRDVGDSMRT
jgi:DNA-binding transcriptional LysR family regulator